MTGGSPEACGRKITAKLPGRDEMASLVQAGCAVLVPAGPGFQMPSPLPAPTPLFPPSCNPSKASVSKEARTTGSLVIPDIL